MVVEVLLVPICNPISTWWGWGVRYYVRYFMTFWCINFMKCLITGWRILRFFKLYYCMYMVGAILVPFGCVVCCWRCPCLNLVSLLVCNVWVIRWIVLLCLAIYSSLVCWFVHVKRKQGYMSLLIFVHIVQLKYAWVSGQKNVFSYGSPYCKYQSLSFWVICASYILEAF